MQQSAEAGQAKEKASRIWMFWDHYQGVESHNVKKGKRCSAKSQARGQYYWKCHHHETGGKGRAEDLVEGSGHADGWEWEGDQGPGQSRGTQPMGTEEALEFE